MKVAATALPFHRLGNSGVLYTLMHRRLQIVADRAGAMGYGFQIVVSYRDAVAQMAAFKAGKSKAKPGHSPHNFNPARAFDFIDHPFTGWNDIPAFRAGAHVFSAAATLVGDDIVWGADWNDNGSEADEHGLRDFDHIELADWRRL